MTHLISLNTWKSISPEERDQIRIKWKITGDDGFQLVSEAINEFQNKYNHFDDITRVCSACGPAGEYYSTTISNFYEECKELGKYKNTFDNSPYIAVTTKLSGKQQIKELPSEYAFFKVVQEPFGDTSQEYLNEWILLLKNLLGWSADKTIIWAEENHSDNLKGKNGWFDHEFPSHYIVKLLIPETVINNISTNHINNILIQLENAIQFEGIPVSHPDYHWDNCRQRIQEILNKITI